MRRSFKMGFSLKNIPQVNLITGPKFHFNVSTGTGVIKKLFARLSDHLPKPPTPPLYNLDRLDGILSKRYIFIATTCLK